MKLNKDLIYLTIIVGLIALSAQFYFSFQVQPVLEAQQQRNVKVYYNRDIQTNEVVINQIQQAEKYVYFAIYTFTRSDIKDALLAAKYKGLEVKGVIDKEQSQKIDEQKAIIKELQTFGIPISFQDHSAIMHLKLLVTDKSYVSGSYNWTASATDKNDEVIEIGNDESIRKQYLAVMQEIFNNYPPK